MKNRISVLSLIVTGTLLIFFFSVATGVETKAVSEGMDVPTLSLATPQSKDAREYLGLKESSSFDLSEIPAKLVLVEVFHVLCQYCQKQAPEMNRIYGLIEQDPELRGNIKMFAIGIQSETKSLDAFKKTFHIKFPILPDQNLETFNKLGDPTIPFLMLVDHQGKVLLTHKGYLKDGDEFFRRIKDFYAQQQATARQ